MKEEKEDYKKKIKVCKMLGADVFKDVVLTAEKIKFGFIEHCAPWIPKAYNKWLDKKRDKELAKSTTEEQSSQIIDFYRNEKMAFAKEIKNKKSRNYHVDRNNPLGVLPFLEKNKQIHENGIKKDAVLFGLFGVGALLGVQFAGILTAFTVASAFINFQCINIQNCNIYRIKAMNEKKLKERAEKTMQMQEQKYGKAVQVLAKTLSETKDIPTAEEIDKNIKTLEEIRQMREFLLSVQNSKTKESTQKVLQKGGK